MSVLLQRTVLIAVTAACIAPRVGRTQSTLTSSTLAVEEQTTERWMHGRQFARFTRFARPHEFFFIDSIQIGASRRLFITVDRTSSGRDSALVVADSLGHLSKLHVGLSGPHQNVSEDELHMSETRLWDLVPTAPPGIPRVGMMWTDTIAREAVDGPFSQTLHGRRVNRIVADTTIAGHHAWRVRDSAIVTLDQHFPQGDAPADSATRISRSVRGIVRGTHLYDPQQRLDLWRADTAHLAGEAVLRYPDGRVFRTPARYERMRRFDLYDSVAYTARRAVLRRARERGGDGMVFLPTETWEKRLADGDPRLLDSLIGVWRRTTDPDDAFDLFVNMQMWSRGGPALQRLDSVRVAAGDTAFLYETLTHQAYGRRHAVDSAEARAMIAFMDPAMVWSIGSSHVWLASDLVQGLLTSPRAAGLATPGCTVAGCAVLGRQWSRGKDQTLRDVGLVALFTTDPSRWTAPRIRCCTTQRYSRAALVRRGPPRPRRRCRHPTVIGAHGSSG